MTNIDTIKPASLETVVPFGKYKGRTLGEAMGDREYFDWVSLQPWFAERYAAIAAALKYGTTPTGDEPTPEHNAMQLRFLDDETALRVMEKIRFPDGAPYSIDEKMLRECWVEFENGNWDVRCSFTAGPKNTSADRSAYLHEYGGYYLVELKPIIGDDYPSVLRKVKQRANPRDEWGIVIQGGTRVVICDRFESTVATLGQVKQLFEKSDVKFLQWSEIEPVKEQCK